jgi:nitroreductase
LRENASITEIITQRFSCRTFLNKPIPKELLKQMKEFILQNTTSYFGSQMRVELIAAEADDRKLLRGLGSYGFIKGASGFIIGAISSGGKYLEDFGFCLESIVLEATRLGIGTCWLGGTFTKSSFARRIVARGDERIPAVIAIGLIEDETQARKTTLRASIGSDRRLGWDTLFFDGQFTDPLTHEKASSYEQVLEMVQIAPSASNKQPWRVVRNEDGFHFYLKRTRGYRNSMTAVLAIEDMQRLDMGIAMCHFDLTARALGLEGKWQIQAPFIDTGENLAEYCFSWLINNSA